MHAQRRARLAFSGTSVTSPRDVIAVAVMVRSLLALLSKLQGSGCLTHLRREGGQGFQATSLGA